MKGTLFTDQLVRAILDDRKTVTRRRMRLQPKGALYLAPPHPGRWADGRGRPLPAPPGTPGEVQYVREVWAPGPTGTTLYRATHDAPAPDRWRSSLLMPASRARLFIAVTDVRPVLLAALDDAEAHREGIESAAAFREGWDRLHAGHSDVLWERNPWVWRMEFERCAGPAEEP